MSEGAELLLTYVEYFFWGLGGLFVIGLIGKALEEEGLKSWSDEKLEARSAYLAARNKSTMMIWREQHRREKLATKQRTKDDWSKYE